MINRTIAAIATPLGSGGIGIIRISGPDAHAILKATFIPKGRNREICSKNSSENHFSSHRVYYGHIVDSVNGNYIDEVLSIYMQGPKSFTREDVAEIHSHSGFVVLDRILSTVFDAGAVLAQPGEFIKRAFLNGRIDLTQAEAVVDLINAPCDTALQMASKNITGGLRDIVEHLIYNLYALRAQCEAAIEFDDAEDLDQKLRLQDIQRMIRQLILPEINTLINRQKDRAVFKEGAVLAIAGIPNVGKSSLLNRLVENETAIVSEIPGTTRDIVKEYISINGVPVMICDTAGIHESKDPVECLGMEKARNQIKNGDIILFVIEATRGLDRYEATLLDGCDPQKTIVVINKDDLSEAGDFFQIEKNTATYRSVRVSAKFGNGLDELKDLIFNILTAGRELGIDEIVTPNLRQRKVLEKARNELLNGIMDNEIGTSIEIMSEILNDVTTTLEEICGQRNSEVLYDHIFSQFCIGK